MPNVVEEPSISSTECSVCSKDFEKNYNVKNILQCSLCSCYLHVECTKVRTVEKLKNVRKDTWRCDACVEKSQSDPVYQVLQKVLTQQSQIITQNNATHVQLNKIANLEVKAEEHTKSLEFISQKFDDFTVFVQETQAALSSHEKMIHAVEDVQVKQQKEIQDLLTRIQDLEQRSRNCNLEISNVPETAKEDAVLIAVKIGQVLGIQNAKEQIQVAHRVMSKKSPKPLIVNLCSRSVRDQWLQAYRAKKMMFTDELNSHFTRQRVYINQHLAPHLKLLLGQVKSFARDNGIKYVWTRDNKIFVKQDDNHNIIKINTIDDLKQFKQI